MPRAALAVILGIAVLAGFVVLVVMKRSGSMPGPQIWLALAITVGGVVTLVMMVVARASRGAGSGGSARAAEAAEQLGLSYEPEGDKEFRNRFRDLPEVPGNCRIKHVLLGELEGRALVIFESTYMIYTGQATVPVASTVYAVESPDWPVTYVTPRSLLSRLFARMNATTGLKLESREFNCRFSIRTDDEDFAVALLGPDMQAFMLTKTRVRWRIGSGRVCLTYSGTLKPDRIGASLDRLLSFWSWVPRELESW
ncbi:MAG: hypothetical protein ACYSU7_04415 [Planctomycetota bacterium]|jgi:hypothetical protein